MELTDQPCYLASVHFFEDRRKDSDGGSVVEITLEFQDLGPDLCDAINPGVRSRLFTRDGGKPVDELAAATINIPVKLHVVHLAAASGVKPNITMTEAEPRPSFKVRRLKKAPQYVGTLKFTATHPDKHLLEQLVYGLRKQHRLTVAPQQGSIDDVALQPKEPALKGRRAGAAQEPLPSTGDVPPAKPSPRAH